MGLFLIVAKILPQNSKGTSLMCTVYYLCVQCMVYSFPPAAEICARLADIFCQYGTQYLVDNSKV
jgi:hypothetical protein